ncbi:MAG: alkaline phosphatase family protein [Rhodothermales bacterium]
MKHLILILSVLCLALAGCQPTSTPVAQHVIVLGVDGMSPSGVQKATTPHLNRVIREGAFTLKARAVLGTSSSQNWASMIMGAGPEQHGVTSNGWERNSYSIAPTATGMEDIFPTIFGVVKEQMPAAKTASIYDWGGFGRLYEKSAVDVDKNPEGPEETMAEAVALINEGIPTFTFIHLDHVDGAGHGFGHASDEYFTSVELADKLLGDLLTALDEGGHWDNTLLIISADHGGIGTRHGGESMLELEIPWMAMGAGVIAGKRILDPVDTYDTAATAAYALGIEQPYAWIARPVTSAFVGGADHAKVAAVPYAPAPRLSPSSGEITDAGLTLTATVDHPDATIRYTLDGSDPNTASTLYEGPVTLAEPTLIKTKSFTTGGGESSISSSEYLTAGNGVQYKYYEGDWQAIPKFSNLRPVRTDEIAQYDLTAVEKRADHYSIHFDADLQVDQAGSYTFELMSDDGSMMWVNGKELINLDGPGGARNKTGEIQLDAGRHHVEVAYLETYGDNVLNVRYAGPGIPMQQIPARKLFKR